MFSKFSIYAHYSHNFFQNKPDNGLKEVKLFAIYSVKQIYNFQLHMSFHKPQVIGLPETDTSPSLVIILHVLLV